MENTDPGSGTVPERGGELDAMIAAHETTLLRYATRLLNSADAAQDVVQGSFIRLAGQWTECRAWSADYVRNWLFRVTHNGAVDFIRKEERIKKLHEAHALEAPSAFAPDPAAALEAEDRRQLVLRAMESLPFAEREVLILRLDQGLSYEEIGRITGRSEGNVGCLLSQGSKKLAARLRSVGAAVS